jgi:hypothetical protein
VTFQYMNTMCNGLTRIIVMSVISDICYFFVLGTIAFFKNYFSIFSSICSLNGGFIVTILNQLILYVH